ncbi:MAG: ABC transporter permease [Thermomicrobiales bacterium]
MSNGLTPSRLRAPEGGSAPPRELTEAPPPSGLWRVTLGWLLRDRQGRAGLILVGLMVLEAIFAPLIAPYPPLELAPREQFQPPSWSRPFGSDEFGRDLLSRVIYGSRISLIAGGGAVLLGALIGVSLGMIAGYCRGLTETILARLFDLILAFPAVLLAIAAIAVLGRSTQSAVIAIGLINVPAFARMARASVLTESEKEYVEAVRSVGAGHWHLLVRTLLPNVLPPVMVLASVAMAAAILLEASLSFLGLGTQPPAPSWGNMVSAGRTYLSNAPWYGVFPGLFIMVLILGLNLLGDGLRDALDPRRQRRFKG